MGASPAVRVRQRPMASKFSSDSPTGSIRAWQAAHAGLRRCSSIRSRIESTAADFSSFSGGTFAGGGGGGVPSRFSSTHLPRTTGEVRVA